MVCFWVICVEDWRFSMTSFSVFWCQDYKKNLQTRLVKLLFWSKVVHIPDHNLPITDKIRCQHWFVEKRYGLQTKDYYLIDVTVSIDYSHSAISKFTMKYIKTYKKVDLATFFPKDYVSSQWSSPSIQSPLSY